MRSLLVATLLVAASPGIAQAAAPSATPSATQPPTGEATSTPTAPAQGPDVELHVPRAEVKKVDLEVENLQARLDVDTRVANLVQISAGVIATVEKLKVQLEDVAAETHLVVRLDRVADVMSRALGAIDRHPDLAGLSGRSEATVAPAAVQAGAAVEVPPAAAPAAPAPSAVPAAPAGSRTGVTP